MAKTYLVSGKGGVGKTTFAAALAKSLDQKRSGPVLLIDIESNGDLAKQFGSSDRSYQAKKLLHSNDVWISTLNGEEGFQEYFSKLFQKSSTQDKVFRGAFSNFSQKIIQRVLENPIVRSFIEVCPGLKPIVILGKICYEAQKGRKPESEQKWAHVIVDAPSSGYVKMLFRSMSALKKAFPIGKVHQQAKETLEYVKNPSDFSLTIVTLLEELPLTESLELSREMKELNVNTETVVFNKAPMEEKAGDYTSCSDSKIRNFLETEEDSAQEKRALLEKYSQIEDFRKIQQIVLPNVFEDDALLQSQKLSSQIRAHKEGPQ